MKKTLCIFAALAALSSSALADEAPVPESAPAPAVAAAANPIADLDAAKAYIAAYADNVQNDKDFRAKESAALAVIRTNIPFFGTWWAIFPPILAIILALVTKEVYSSLFAGIVAGGLLYSGFAFEGTIRHVMTTGFVKSVADTYNIGILFFLILLGALVSMMNKTGASAAFGRWA